MADFATLQAETLKLDATATLRGHADGTLSLQLNGAAFTLLPDYELIVIPAAHANAAWWIGEEGKLYLRYPSLRRAQGFGVR